ncbi:MAG: helical backbone metal receptor [Burkholderiaceae bacterium]
MSGRRSASAAFAGGRAVAAVLLGMAALLGKAALLGTAALAGGPGAAAPQSAAPQPATSQAAAPQAEAPQAEAPQLSASQPAASRPPAAAAIIDDWGRRLEASGPAVRIVSLAPHATDLLFEAGLGARVMAVDHDSDFPPAAARLPQLPAYPPPDLERLLAMRPDLVIVWGAGARAPWVERLTALGVRVFVSEPRSLDEVGRSLARFGAFGSADEARRAQLAAQRFAGQLAGLRERFAGRPPVRVFVQVWSAPLIGLSDRDVIGDALRSCGAVNVFGDAAVAAPRLDPEAVLAARPQLVLATDGQASARRWRERGLLQPAGPARFAVFDASLLHRPGPRILQAVRRLCDEIETVRSGRVQP